jgi:hypothetical protein
MGGIMVVQNAYKNYGCYKNQNQKMYHQQMTIPQKPNKR